MEASADTQSSASGGSGSSKRVVAWGGDAEAERSASYQHRWAQPGIDCEDADSDGDAVKDVVVPVGPVDATMLLEDAISTPLGEPSGVVEQPVLSLVSLNTRTATTVDILRGNFSVLPQMPDSSKSVRTVRISCGRDPSNTIVLKDSRVSLHHFTVRVRAAAGGRVVLDLKDESSNGTWIDGRRVGRGQSVVLSVGVRIIALPAALVGRDGEVGYVLLHDTKGARCDSASMAAVASSPARAAVETASSETSEAAKGLPRSLEQDLRCGICTDVLHKCLTVVPCGHNFCAVCLARWRKRSVLCPGCRGPIRQAVQNFEIDRVSETFLRAHPEAGRSAEEIAALDRAAYDPESAAHLRWLLRDPGQSNYVGSANFPPIHVASPQRHQTRQARPQSGRSTSRLGQPRAQATGQQRPQSAEAPRQQRGGNRVSSSACVIC